VCSRRRLFGLTNLCADLGRRWARGWRGASGRFGACGERRTLAAKQAETRSCRTEGVSYDQQRTNPPRDCPLNRGDHPGPQGGDNWPVSYLIHSASAEPTESRSAAWRLASHPAERCSTCCVITKGKADKITGDKVAVPAVKKAPAKRAAKKSA
jgi:hypothetical protein